MSKVRPISVVLAAALVAGGTYLFQAFNDPAEAPTAAPTAPALAAASLPVSDTRELDRLIGVFTELASQTEDPLNYRFLGQLYYSKARLTLDIDDYARAGEALSTSYELAPSNLDTRSTLAATSLALHDFESALEMADAVYGADPTRLEALAIVGDAQLALGAYEEAGATYGRIAAELPDNPAALVRQAQLAYVRGDADLALRAAAAAVQRARTTGLSGPDLSYYLAFEGDLAFELGDYLRSLDLYSAAVEAAPESPLAQAGLARTTAATGDLDSAIELYQAATARVPDPGYLSALGDLYALTDRPELAETQYATVELIGTLSEINGQVYNRQLALFYADHNQADRALELAEAELATRTDVGGQDAYAWALFRNGQFEEARAAADQALAFGTPDAHFYYHSGLISAALGDGRHAAEHLKTALELNPAFDPILSRHAESVLAELQAG